MTDYAIDSGPITAAASLSGGITAASGVSGTIEAIALLTGALRKHGSLGGSIEAEATLQGSLSNILGIDGAIPIDVDLRGVVRARFRMMDPLNKNLQRICADATLWGDLTATKALMPGDVESINLGQTVPVMGVVVHGFNVFGMADLVMQNVQEGEYFIVGTGQANQPEFAAYLAQPNDIGQRTSDGFRFRAPQTDEVIWRVSRDAASNTRDNGLYRMIAGQWTPYKPTTERALSVEPLYPAADPDGVMAFVGRLWGFLMAGMLRDANSMSGFYDVFAVPDRLLAYYAAAMGIDAVSNDPETLRRSLRGAILIAKNAGMPVTVGIVLRHLGLQGYGREVWANPTAATNWTTQAQLLEQQPDTYTEINSRCGDRMPADDSGQKGIDIISQPHQPTPDMPTVYFPTPGFGVHVNYGNGGPIDMAASNMPQFRETLANALYGQALPAASFIRYICTDYPSVDQTSAVDEVSGQDVSHVSWRVYGRIKSKVNMTGRLTPAAGVGGSIVIGVTLKGAVAIQLSGTIPAVAVTKGNWRVTMRGKISAKATLTGNFPVTT